MPDGEIRERYERAGADGSVVVLEGLHALKHAVRFGAEVEHVVSPDLEKLRRLVDELAPDLADFITANATAVSRELFGELTARPPASPVLSIAAARRAGERKDTGTTVVLYEPRHAGNVGATIRVAAAAGATAVVVIGELDPWAPAVIRASAGLHYAMDIHQQPWPQTFTCPLIAFDAQGSSEVTTRPTDTDVAYLFGSERHGLPPEVLAAASGLRRIPMRAGVSSLNLATSVAVALYAQGSPARQKDDRPLE